MSKGFSENSKRDHHYYFYRHKGKKSDIHTKISHGENEIDDSLCSRMARQIRLTRREFDAFVECGLTAEEYSRMLEEKDLL
jgi:hypothetical protein